MVLTGKKTTEEGTQRASVQAKGREKGWPKQREISGREKVDRAITVRKKKGFQRLRDFPVRSRDKTSTSRNEPPSNN